MYNWNRVFPAKRLRRHMDRNPLAQVLNLEFHFDIIPLRFLYDWVEMIFDGLPVPLIDWYKKVWAGLEMSSPTRWGCCGAIASVTEVATASSLQMKLMDTADIWLIQRRKTTVCLRICVLSSKLSVGALGELTESIFCTGYSSCVFLLWPTTAFFYIDRYRSARPVWREPFSIALLTYFGSSTVKAGRSTMQPTSSFSICGSVRSFWTAFPPIFGAQGSGRARRQIY